MKKTYLIEGLDCANCAAALERGLLRLEEISSASVNFLTTKVVLEVAEENFEATYEKILKVVGKVEPDAVLTEF